MLGLNQIKILAQLVNNTELYIDRLEEAYKKNNAQEFNASKKDILNAQKKILLNSK